MTNNLYVLFFDYHFFSNVCCSCLGMFHYGLMIDDHVLIFLNGVGSFLQLFYVVLYLLVARSKVQYCLSLLSILAYGGDTQSRKLRKKLAILVQVHASSADDTSNKNGHLWMKQITFSILSVDHSMGTQNFYLNNLNKLKK